MFPNLSVFNLYIILHYYLIIYLKIFLSLCKQCRVQKCGHATGNNCLPFNQCHDTAVCRESCRVLRELSRVARVVACRESCRMSWELPRVTRVIACCESCCVSLEFLRVTRVIGCRESCHVHPSLPRFLFRNNFVSRLIINCTNCDNFVYYTGKHVFSW